MAILKGLYMERPSRGVWTHGTRMAALYAWPVLHRYPCCLLAAYCCCLLACLLLSLLLLLLLLLLYHTAMDA